MPVPKHRSGSLKFKGVQYENRVASLFKDTLDCEVLHGPWIRYEDKNGEGLCQPDIVILKPDYLIIGECKLKHRGTAKSQLLDLYKPCLEHIYPDKKAYSVQICKHLSRRMSGDIIETLDEITPDFEKPYVIYNLRRVIL